MGGKYSSPDTEELNGKLQVISGWGGYPVYE